MTVVDFVRLSRANAAVIFAMFSLGLICAFLYTLRQPVVFTACSQGTVIVASDNTIAGQYSANSLALQKLATYAGLATSTNVANRVIKDLRLNATPGEIAGRFTASPADGQPVLNICASGPSPAGARDLANAVIGAMSKEAARLESAALPSGAAPSNLIRLEPTEQAGVPSAPTSPNYPRNLLAGAGVGILLGYAASLVRRQLDRRVRTVDDIETLVGTSVLSIVPESEELDREDAVGLVQSQSGAAAESLRQLRTNLRFVDVDNPPRSIVMTSANAGEGKSVVAANLARVLAAAGQPTILLDGDLRRPMVATLFDLDPTVGLTQVLAGDIALDDVIVDPGIPNLRLIVAGRIPPNPSELLGSQRMQSVIRELVDEGYLVLIDAPPLLPVTDAGLLAGTVDGVLLVLAVGRTYKEQGRLAAKVLGQVGGHLLGAVLNRAPLRGIGSVVYGYGYATYGSDYYGSYVTRDAGRSGSSRRTPAAGSAGGTSGGRSGGRSSGRSSRKERNREKQRQKLAEQAVREAPEPTAGAVTAPGVVPFRTPQAPAAAPTARPVARSAPAADPAVGARRAAAPAQQPTAPTAGTIPRHGPGPFPGAEHAGAPAAPQTGTQTRTQADTQSAPPASAPAARPASRRAGARSETPPTTQPPVWPPPRNPPSTPGKRRAG